MQKIMSRLFLAAQLYRFSLRARRKYSMKF